MDMGCDAHDKCCYAFSSASAHGYIVADKFVWIRLISETFFNSSWEAALLLHIHYQFNISVYSAIWIPDNSLIVLV